jgi:FKBP12-rapamycin complex-associated protein
MKHCKNTKKNCKDSVAIAGKMKCLEALGRWEDAVKLCEENVDRMRIEAEQAKTQTHVKAAVIGARAAWSLNEWDLMDDFVSHLPADNVDGSFMKAVLAVHAEKYSEAQKHLEVTRKHLDKMITSLMSESYGRAYMPLIMVQQCSELEEITEYQMFLKENGLAGDAELDFVTTISLEKFSMDADASVSSLEDNAGIPRRPNRHVAISTLLSSDRNERSNSDLSSGNLQIVREEAFRRKMFLSEKWRRRIRGCASTGRAAIPYWKYLLNGRRMILSEKEDIDTWLDFVSLCRNGGNTALAERVLTMSQWSAMSSIGDSLREIGTTTTSSHFNVVSGQGSNMFAPMSEESVVIMERRIKFAMLKQQWVKNNRLEALQELDNMVKTIPAVGHHPSSGIDSSYLSCLLKLGEWKIGILDPGKPVDINTRMEVLALYSRATAVDPSSYRAAHQWGLSNYRAVEELKGSFIGRSGVGALNNSSVKSNSTFHRSLSNNSAPPQQPQMSKEQINTFVINAIKGFMRALSLGTRKFSSSVMQDMLCILSLWFQYGKYPDVISTLEHGLSQVPLDNWLGILPQLIARIDHPDRNTRALLHSLIMRLGAKHPQALVYPLSVALKNPRGDRKEAAEQLMTGLRQHSTKLIDQAVLVSQELVRVAILWEEWWHWVLEDASRLCFGDGNIQGMLEMLEPLHEAVEKGPATIREATFIETYKFELHQAWECLQMYRRTMEERHLPIPTGQRNPLPSKHHAGPVIDDQYIQQAWELYYSVFKRINGQINLIHSLDLQSTSPALFTANDLDIGVPGTYQVNGQAVKIKSFNPVVAIIRSKQRPRKIRITGEDGHEYVFLLKGHEDLRQDERAMQLFGLVNALLYHDRRTGVNSEDLQIQRYCVMPLSPSVGLIGWVPACDTLHDLIRSYRDSRKTLLDMEAKLITQAANNQFEKLPIMHKLEVFEYAISFTQGEDLAKILWLKSENSESWLQRRATYTRSLAVMSMVGYILGLGDRHPSNLMLDKKTGKVLHIDFGDCFEVAMHREKFPEKVPFRLTRMLVSAMEVAGIEGNFRSTCEKVMAVLRENRDSLVATLEAFVHDPLISWRLMNIKGKNTTKKLLTAKPNINLPDPATSSTTNTSSAVAAIPSTVEGKPVPDAASTTPSDREAGALTPVSTAEVVTSAVVDATTPVDTASSVSTNGNGRQRSRSITKGGFVTRLEPIAEQVRASQNVDDHEEDEDEDTENASPMRRKGRSGSITASKNVHESEQDDDERILSEGNPFSAPVTSPTKTLAVDGPASPPRDAAATLSPVLSRSLLSSEMALRLSTPTTVPSTATGARATAPATGVDENSASASSLLSTPQGFAEHSAIRRPSLTPRNDGTSGASTGAHGTNGGAAAGANSVAGMPTGPGGATIIPSALSSSYIAMATISNPVLTNPTQKSVSFSHTNLAIDPDNTVRPCAANQPIIPNTMPPLPVLSASAATLAPPAPSHSPRATNGGNTAIGNGIDGGNISPTKMPVASTVSPFSAATAASTMSTTATTIATTTTPAHTTSGLAAMAGPSPAIAGMNGPMSLSSSVIRGDIHMEIAKLSAKTFDKQSSQVMSASMRHHSSLSSMAMSHRMSSLHSGGLTGPGGVGTNNSSAATSEASQQMLMMTQQEALLQQELTEKAVVVIRRVLDKLNGLDFASHWDPSSSNQQLQVADQVDRLIQEATSNENLSQSFFGWCPFW